MSISRAHHAHAWKCCTTRSSDFGPAERFSVWPGPLFWKCVRFVTYGPTGLDIRGPSHSLEDTLLNRSSILDRLSAQPTYASCMNVQHAINSSQCHLRTANRCIRTPSDFLASNTLNGLGASGTGLSGAEPGDQARNQVDRSEKRYSKKKCTHIRDILTPKCDKPALVLRGAQCRISGISTG